MGDRAKKGRASRIVGGILDEALKPSVENKISPFIIQELREKKHVFNLIDVVSMISKGLI